MIQESIAMYTLWALIELLSAAGALNGAKGVEQVFMQPLELEKQHSNTLFYRVLPPPMEMEGRIERLRLVMHNTGTLFRVDIDLADNCISREEIKEHFPDLYFAHVDSPAPIAEALYASRSMDVPVIFAFVQKEPDCLAAITIDYQSRIDEYGAPPPVSHDE